MYMEEMSAVDPQNFRRYLGSNQIPSCFFFSFKNYYRFRPKSGLLDYQIVM